MPFIIPYIIQIIVAIIISIALSAISKALAPKPKKLGGFTTGKSGRITQIQQPVSVRDIVYGEIRKSGTVVFGASTNDNKYLHIVITLASHEVHAIPIVFLNNEPIYSDQLDADNIVTSGKYADNVRVKVHLGADDQVADADLVADVTEWTTAHRLRGIAYVYVRLTFDTDVFPSGIPSISAYVQGKKVTEIRDSALPSQYTANSALIIRDYIVAATTDMGLGFTTAEIDDTFLTATANTCDEFVTTTSLIYTISSVDITNDALMISETVPLSLITGDKVSVTSTGSIPAGAGADQYVTLYKPFPGEDVTPGIRLATTYENALLGVYIDITDVGSGVIKVTKTAEPRYTASGFIDSDREPYNNLGDLMTSMGGRATYSGGTWKIRPGVYYTPTLSYNESDLIQSISVQTKHSRKDRFNAVKGTYTSQVNLGVEAEYPAVTNSLYETEDNGERIFTEYPLEFTPRPHTAMRLAKLELERHRQQIIFNGLFKLSGLLTQPGDVIQLSLDTLGWVSKPFEVVAWEFVTKEDGDNLFYAVDMTLVETASGVFDWNNGEETVVDPSPNTTLPNPFSVGAPTGFNLTTETFLSDNGTQFDRMVVSWNPNIDHYVRNDGFVEIQFRKTNDVSSFSDGTYKWLKTADSALNEYYMVLNDSTSGNPNIILPPFQVLLGGTTVSEGTLGSLAAAEWAYGDQDSLGFETLYVRMSDDSDPDDSGNLVQAKYFEPSFLVKGFESQAFISPVRPLTQYDVRIRNINYLGVKSVFNTLFSYTIGSASAGTTASVDYGKVTGLPTSSYDRGSVIDSVDETFDYGAV